MSVTTPEISWHDRDPVYSIDFQHGKHSIRRFATAGVDKFCRIWELKMDSEGKPVIDFLSNLKRHTKSVNVCRFSPNGDILATGGDDSVIILWKLSDVPTPTNNIFQEEEEDNRESWVIGKILRGHLEDVYDLSWSRDGKYLVSGSVDNTAIVWDIAKEQRLALFNEHKSFVQGVALDPVGDYLATMSTDRDCRIFNLNTKNVMYRVSKMSFPSENTEEKPKSFRMFHDDTMRSFFRRLTFSPDGEFLIVPAGCIEQGDKVTNSTFVFTRNCLNKPAMCLPCGGKVSIAVRCCPKLFELRKPPTEGDEDKDNNNLKEWEKCKALFCLPYRVVFAVATEDEVLLYDTQETQPLLYIKNIHYHQLSDLAWSDDGKVLFVSSTDGYCSVISFTDNELGKHYEPKKQTTGEPISDMKENSSTVDTKTHQKSEVMNEMDTDSPEKEKDQSTKDSGASSDLPMDTDDSESSEKDGGLNLVLELTSDGAQFQEKLKQNKELNKSPAQNHSSSGSPSAKDNKTSASATTSTTVTTITNTSSKSAAPTPTAPQKRRVQLTTLSLLKPS